jgi:SAM-dependent methyltransferase
LFGRSLLATVRAWLLGAPGLRFGAFGRLVGARALLVGERAGLDLLLTPVNIVRYWEFPFARRHLPPRTGSCLDVASPRLFSYYVASYRGPSSIRVINPDVADADLTANLAAVLRLGCIDVEAVPVQALASEGGRYDAIWSISVVEHIPGDGDTAAMRVMYGALAPGGRLIVTVPVDRRPWDEFRDADPYGLGSSRGPQGYFFQRWYDEAAIHTRLIDPIEPPSVALEWFGERVPGRFADYEREWQRFGHRRTVDDPHEIGAWYRPFARWAEMPGQGVCGIAIGKPS